MITFHMAYVGANGIVFGPPQPGAGPGCSGGVTFEVDKGEALIALASLPHGYPNPPARVWPEGLGLLWPGTTIDSSGMVYVPVERLVAPYYNVPASKPTVEAILTAAGTAVTRTAMGRAARLFPDDPQLHRLVHRWIRLRNRKWRCRRVGSSAPNLSRRFMDLLVLANWNEAKVERRLSTILLVLVWALHQISPEEAFFLSLFDWDGRPGSSSTAFHDYLDDRQFEHLQAGPYTEEEEVRIIGCEN